MADAIVPLLDRPVYGLQQVDRLLGLNGGTARRWIDGYRRGRKIYPPVVRAETTGSEVVTWGEFVETRLLAEYRDAGVPLVRMRPAIERLRETFNTPYPLAFARPFAVDKELVLEVQEEVDLDRHLALVVVRNNQVILTEPASRFYASAQFDAGETGSVIRLTPVDAAPEVRIDPLRQFGEPVVRSVRTEIIAEQVRAGESIDSIAELYELSRREVESAVRFELIVGTAAAA